MARRKKAVEVMLEQDLVNVLCWMAASMGYRSINRFLKAQHFYAVAPGRPGVVMVPAVKPELLEEMRTKL